MDVQLIARDPHALQQPIRVETIQAMCERAFGSQSAIETIRELGTGSINNTYILTLHGLPQLILRVAPPPNHPQAFLHEDVLLRQEYQMQPFFAPVASLLPQTIMADFTHQLLDRDYLFQTYIPGTPWSDLHDRLTTEQQSALYRQLGTIARQIHAVTGQAFGTVQRSFRSWSETILNELEQVVAMQEQYQLESRDIRAVLVVAQKRSPILDMITQPHLLHGDLWHQNLLVDWIGDIPQIVGVLDAGFASWGDPPYDWTLIRLSLGPPGEPSSFWESYGELDQSAEAQLRTRIYQARSLGVSLVETLRLQFMEDHKWVQRKLHEITMQLQADDR